MEEGDEAVREEKEEESKDEWEGGFFVIDERQDGRGRQECLAVTVSGVRLTQRKTGRML